MGIISIDPTTYRQLIQRYYEFLVQYGLYHYRDLGRGIAVMNLDTAYLQANSADTYQLPLQYLTPNLPEFKQMFSQQVKSYDPAESVLLYFQNEYYKDRRIYVLPTHNVETPQEISSSVHQGVCRIEPREFDPNLVQYFAAKNYHFLASFYHLSREAFQAEGVVLCDIGKSPFKEAGYLQQIVSASNFALLNITFDRRISDRPYLQSKYRELNLAATTTIAIQNGAISTIRHLDSKSCPPQKCFAFLPKDLQLVLKRYFQ